MQRLQALSGHFDAAPTAQEKKQSLSVVDNRTGNLYTI